ncbi:hypothetical protein LTR66_007073 [Elasticomyces elasticus]|nr:hypothetical protein LTR66_007073 [Elasticomyces elasticus]
MPSAQYQPERYFVTPTPHVPNSPLPVLLYRNVLPSDPTAETAQKTIEKNKWLKGGVFKHYPGRHFHSVTHECYAVFQGSSHLLLGRGPIDEPEGGIEVDVETGDIIILPAGVAHCSLHSSDDYTYMGLYPEGSPHWDNNFCQADAGETAEKARNARGVPVPDHDPIFGLDGPLVEIWRKAAAV